MATVAVNVLVKDENGSAIDGAVVEVYDSLGINLLHSEITGAPFPVGIAEFSLDGEEQGAIYNLRVFKLSTPGLYTPAVLFERRASIRVYDPLPAGVANDFTVVGSSGALSESPDPSWCRVTGYITKQNGVKYPGYAFTIHTLKEPVVVDGAMLGGDRVDLRSDKDGKVVVDLARGGQYTVVMPDYIDEEVIITVPDAPSANLSDLLFLYPKSATFNPAALAMSVGDEATFEISGLVMSDGQDGDPSCYTDPVVVTGNAVVEAEWSSQSNGVSQVLVRALAPGVATVGLQTKPDAWGLGLPIRFPQPSILQTLVNVTVT
jgi:hypothetical protein